MTDNTRNEAVEALAKAALRRYDSEYDATHLTWQHFTHVAESDLAALNAAGWQLVPPGAVVYGPESADIERGLLEANEQFGEALGDINEALGLARNTPASKTVADIRRKEGSND